MRYTKTIGTGNAGEARAHTNLASSSRDGLAIRARRITPPRLFTLVALGLCQCAVTKPPAASAAPKGSSDAEYSLTQSSASAPARGSCRGSDCVEAPQVAPARCDVEECAGELGPAAIAELRATAAKANDCYESALKDQNQLEGRLLVRLRLAAGRDPCEIRIEQKSFDAPEALTQCVLARLRATEARPRSGCVDVALPLAFVRQEIEAAPGSSGTGAPPAQ